jgi:hypothetical protein
MVQREAAIGGFMRWLELLDAQQPQRGDPVPPSL